MSDSAFDSMRLVAVITIVFHRLFLMPSYLQAYLNMAYQRVQEQRKEAGRITNHELQEKVCTVLARPGINCVVSYHLELSFCFRSPVSSFICVLLLFNMSFPYFVAFSLPSFTKFLVSYWF